ncbi:hypothetical protein ACFWOJ_24870 [Streptomyces sp. NPDC058439]
MLFSLAHHASAEASSPSTAWGLRVVGATAPPVIVISRGAQLHLLDLLGL